MWPKNSSFDVNYDLIKKENEEKGKADSDSLNKREPKLKNFSFNKQHFKFNKSGPKLSNESNQQSTNSNSKIQNTVQNFI